MLLKANVRELLGKKVRSLRENKTIPAVAYASGEESISLVIPEKELVQAIKSVGRKALFDLEIEGKPARKAIFRELQFDYLKNKVLHASIFLVDMKNPITTTVPVKIIGMSMAVKNNLGLLINPMSLVEITCLPEKLPSEIEVDISKFDDIGDTVTLKDLILPEGVTVGVGQTLSNIVASIVTPQKAIEEEVTAETAVEGEEGAETDETTKPGEEGKEVKEGKESKDGKESKEGKEAKEPEESKGKARK